MKPTIQRFALASLLLAVLAGCAPEGRAPIVSKARDFAVTASTDGRTLRVVSLRNGLALLAERRNATPLAAHDLLLDEGRQALWLRQGATLYGLSLPGLSEFARIALPAGAADLPLSLTARGSLQLGEEAYLLSGREWVAVAAAGARRYTLKSSSSPSG